ncbi:MULTISPECIES: hypothetical protein [unclassified Yoonia]|uniref:hypothetical protein n=1 Tax=unclassified Yoonia TaxID=2629118 RepID=UPI002AFF29CE|nr:MULTISPECIES: hypothetical protein [unclassified Yoonia]
MFDLTPKHALKSKAIWGGVVAVGGGVAGFFGYSMSPEDTVQLPVLLASIASSVGGVLAIFGRIKADRKIG